MISCDSHEQEQSNIHYKKITIKLAEMNTHLQKHGVRTGTKVTRHKHHYHQTPVKNKSVSDVTRSNTINLDISLFRFSVLKCVTYSTNLLLFFRTEGVHTYFLRLKI